MRCLVFLLLLLCAAAPSDAEQDTLAPDAESRWIAFTLTPADQIRFQASVDGRPATAILDTGVSTSLLSRRFVDAAGMRVRRGHAALAIGGSVASGWVDPERVALGALMRRGGHMMTAALPPAATGEADIDLLVGRDLIAHYALDIDYAMRRFRLLPSGRLPFSGNMAPLRIAGAWPSYVTDLTIGTHHIARMAIDTGDGSAITLTRGAWAALPDAHRPTTSTIAYGVGGAMIVDLAIVSGVRSGDNMPRAVEVRIEGARGYTATIGMNGRIGSGFLKRYRVLLDPDAGRMVLRAASDAESPPVRSTSGLILARARDRLTVLHVMRGGPAAADGWRAGEQICAVDGVKVTDAAALTWPVGTPGNTVQLTLCSGEIRPLTLRAFY